MVPCIPNILKYADISQLAAMMAPRPLTISEPCWASGNPLSASEVGNSFGWARQIYALVQRERSSDHRRQITP